MSLELQGCLACLAAYIVGSIPFGVVVARVCGTPDPRGAGSRNIGFTNMVRVSGTTAGILTLIGDLGKGWLVGWIMRGAAMPGPWALGAVFAVVLGHLFPVCIGFRGGKGVATGLGGITGLCPPLGLLLVVLWAAAVGLWRYSSWGAIMAFGSLPVFGWLVKPDMEFTIFTVLLAALVIARHKSNIERLLNGTEPLIGCGPDKSII